MRLGFFGCAIDGVERDGLMRGMRTRETVRLLSQEGQDPVGS